MSFALHLKVANGPCVETSETLEKEFLPEFEWTLLPTSLCDDDEAKALSYVPPGAKLVGEDRLAKHHGHRVHLGQRLADDVVFGHCTPPATIRPAASSIASKILM